MKGKNENENKNKNKNLFGMFDKEGKTCYYYNFVLGHNRDVHPDTFLLPPCPPEKYSQVVQQEKVKDLNTIYKVCVENMCGESGSGE